MKEKTIEKRGMKMKKVFVTLLMLMMVVGLFAATTSGNDTAKVTATVGAINEAWFATADDTESEPDGVVEVSLNNDESAELDYTKTVTIYATAKTNVTSGCNIKITGSALTLDSVTSNHPDNSYIDLLISTIETGESATPQTYVASSPASGEPTSHYTGSEEAIEFNLTPDNGLDTLNKGLSITVNDGASNTKNGKLAAGSYSAWLIMTYSANA